MNVSTNQQVRVGLFEFIKESIIDDRNLGDIDILKLSALRQELLEAVISDGLALDELDMFEVRHDLQKLRYGSITDRST